jgi:hypothetical protein
VTRSTENLLITYYKALFKIRQENSPQLSYTFAQDTQKKGKGVLPQ